MKSRGIKSCSINAASFSSAFCLHRQSSTPHDIVCMHALAMQLSMYLQSRRTPRKGSILRKGSVQVQVFWIRRSGNQNTVHMCLCFFSRSCFRTCCSAWEHGQQFACEPHHNVSKAVKVRHARIRAVISIDLRQNKKGLLILILIGTSSTRETSRSRRTSIPCYTLGFPGPEFVRRVG